MPRLRSGPVRAKTTGFAGLALPLLVALATSCSAAGEPGGWCSRVDRVTRVESGGLGRVALDPESVDELSEAYEALVGDAPFELVPEVQLVRDFTASIALRLADGTDAIEVIDEVTRDYDVSAVEAAHSAILADRDQRCDAG